MRWKIFKKINLIKNYSESKTLSIFIEYHFELNYENIVFAQTPTAWEVSIYADA